MYNPKPGKLRQFELWEFVGAFPTKQKAENHAESEDITDYFIEEAKNSSTAVSIAAGFCGGEIEAEQIEAWQYLVDTGLAWDLRDWFGRTATKLIEQGIIVEEAEMASLRKNATSQYLRQDR